MHRPQNMEPQDVLEVARATMMAEAKAIEHAVGRLEGSFCQAVNAILAHEGKLILTGVGKSGHVGRKIVASLCSTGTPAIFLHPSEAVHGDLGVYSPGDPTVIVSKSGTTAELLRLIPVLRRFESPLIGILGNLNSPLARQVDVVLDARVDREAGPLNLAPTNSSTVALALGDALAAALMAARGFEVEDYAKIHPGGQLGRDLKLTVRDVMHASAGVAHARPQDSLRQVVIEMTRYPLGAAVITNGQRKLEGIITDGDVRRALEQHEDMRNLSVQDVMTPEPITISCEETLLEAAHLMENRSSQISVLPVVDGNRRCLGLIRIHDVYRAELSINGR